jgi:hypothetical protein
MTEMTLEEIATEQKRADDAFATDVLDIGCGWYRRVLALTRRALELEEREAGLWGRVNALAEKVLGQPSAGTRRASDIIRENADAIQAFAGERSAELSAYLLSLFEREALEQPVPTGELKQHLLAMARNVRAGLMKAADYDDEVATLYNAMLWACKSAQAPAPTGEVLQRHLDEARAAASGTLCGAEWIAGYARGMALGEQAAYQRGRQEAQGAIAARPVVRWFAECMEATLRRNDHKGGWQDDTPERLSERIGQEWAELEERLGKRQSPQNHLAIIGEAADVANMAMMVADWSRFGGPSRDQGHDVPGYQRGRQEAQGGWVEALRQRLQHAMSCPIEHETMDYVQGRRHAFTVALNTLAELAPPSDTGKGGR